jgi:hypothetical protein
MFKRNYFINGKCTDNSGYCYLSRIGTYSSFTAQVDVVFTMMTNELKKELLEIMPQGNFEVVSFNRI